MNEAIKTLIVPFPLVHLILSNNSPTDSELAQMANLVRDIDADFDMLADRENIDIDRLQQIHPLIPLRTSLKHAMSPIRRLPTEILSEIFLYCLRTWRSRSWNDLDCKRQPWTLVGVSKRWRDVALGDPRLWSSIGLQVGQGNVNVIGLRLCLARSGQHPLVLSFLNEPSLLHQFLQESLPYSNRWALLELNLFPENLESLKFIQGAMPELRELRISSQFPAGFDTPDWISHVFETTPKLRKAIIQLRSREGLWVDSIRILSHCHQLVECDLFFYYTDERELADSHPAITLYNLQKLSTNFTKILNFLELPSLNSLFLYGSVGQLQCYVYIRSVMSRSRCTINTLDLRDAHFQRGSYLRQLIEESPDLLTVVVPQHAINDVFARDVPLPAGWQLDQAESSIGQVTYKRESRER